MVPQEVSSRMVIIARHLTHDMGNYNSISRAQVEQLRTKVDMPANEIKALYEEYKKSCRYGNQITVHDFQDIYKDMFSGDSATFTEHIFRVFDKNGNGKVDFEEFLIGVCVMSSNDVEKKLKWSFNIYDIDGNGSIDKDEMTAIIRSAYKMHEDGVPINNTTPEKLAERLFKDMDTNGDGVISWEEFRTGAMKDPAVLQLLQAR